MKSCIEWRKDFKYLDKVDEYNINYKNKTKQLLYFLDHYGLGEKRVNIVIEKPTIEDIELIVAVKHRNENYNIAVCTDIDMYCINQLKENNIPFYLNTHINSFDALQFAINLGVSDVFITEELGFDLKRVHEITSKAGIKIRCYANISQIQYPYEGNDGLKGFYIRPEDIEVYEEYVDIIEFYKSVDIQNTLYDVYFISKHWDGQLREIIKGLRNTVNNYYILTDEFAKRRVHCRKKCIKSERCQLCERIVELADTLEKSDDYEVFRNNIKESEEDGERRSSEGTDIPEDAGNV